MTSQTPAVEIEAKLKADSALKSLSDLRGAIQKDLTEALDTSKITAKDLSKELVGGLAQAISPLALVGTAVAGVGSAFRALTQYTRESIAAASESEEAELKLSRVLQLRGENTTATVEALKAFNDELERGTALDGDQLLGIQGMLSSMGVLEGDLKNVTLAVIGFSERFGKELPESAKIVGKALVENREALREYGLDLKTNEEVIAALAPSAQLAADRTELLSGKLAQQSTAWGNLSEAFGRIFTESEGVKVAMERITGSIQIATSVIEAMGPVITRTLDGMSRLVTMAQSIRWGDNAYNFSEPLVPKPEEKKVDTRNRKDVIYTTVDEEMRKRLAAEAERLRKKWDQESQDMVSGRRGGKGRSLAEQKEIEDRVEASWRAFEAAEAAAREADLAAYTADLERRASRRLTGVTTNPSGNLVPTYASREGEAMAEEFRLKQQLDMDARIQAHEDERLQVLMDAAYARADLRKKEEEDIRQHWGSVAQLSGQATSQIASQTIATLTTMAVTGEKIEWGRMFGGLLMSIGQTAISLGTVGLAAGLLGEISQIFRPITGGAAGVAASGVLIAAGIGAVAAGAALSKGSAGGGVKTPSIARAGSGGGFTSSSSSFGTPLGFQPSSNLDEPKSTVINVTFSGLMAGSERGLGREIERFLRAAGTLGGN